MSPDHMELPALKRLALRLIAAPVFGEVAPDTVEADLHTHFCRFDTKDPSLSSGSLTEFLTFRLAETRSTMPPLTAKNGPKAKLLTDQLERVIGTQGNGSDLCSQCAKKTRHVCNGLDKARDAQQVAEKGLCISVIHELFGYLKPAISDIVRIWVNGGDARILQNLDVRVSTVWGGDPVKKDPDPDDRWSVGGALVYRDVQVTPKWLSDVQLKFQPMFFGWSSLLCLPWVITHELVCHAFYGFADRQIERDGCARDCPFNEGWMDEVAHQILVADLTDVGRASTRPRCALMEGWQKEIIETAGHYRGWRYGEIPGSSPTIYAPQWRLGKKVARGVYDVFARSVANRDPSAKARWALRQLVRLSYRIQKHGPDSDLSNDIVTCMATVVAKAKAIPSKAKASRPEAKLLGEITLLLNDEIETFSNWMSDLKSLSKKIEQSAKLIHLTNE